MLPQGAREARAREERLRVAVVRWSRPGHDLLKGDGELVRVERTSFADFLARECNLVPGFKRHRLCCSPMVSGPSPDLFYCSRYIRVRDPDSATADRDQGLPFQRVSVLADYFVHQHDALLDGQIRKSYHACVVGSSDVHELAEVVVQRDQDSPLRVGPFQQSCVAWIGFEFTGVEDVVAVAPQPLCKPSAGAAVDEEPHGVFTETAASVSPAITACAYAIHARMSSFSSFG